MTDPAPTDLTQLTDTQLNQALIAASRALIRAQRTRDQALIDAAYADYEALVAERNSRG